MLADTKLTRRGFLISSMAITGGFALAVSGSGRHAGAQTPVVATPIADTQNAAVGLASGDFPPISRPEDFSIWLAILEDDTIIARVPQPESGQGLMTQAVYNVAEELGSDIARWCRNSPPRRSTAC